MPSEVRPQEITIERREGVMQVVWLTGHTSQYALGWLRAHCPCASCREERRSAGLAGLLPSTELVSAELVGNYAIRFTWSDGHGAGIFPFAALRACCPCPTCNPDGVSPLWVE
ncbi:MAG: gamma-butyrobetaine hydroxylase-like domain-containing protein [Caldilinea sp.]